MKRILLCCSLIVPGIGYSCPELAGTWQSSAQKFESFNKRWANVDPDAWSFMTQTQGHEVIDFTTKGTMMISTPEIDLSMGDKTIKMPAKHELIPYDILGCTETSIVLKYDRYGETRISQLHFDSADTYWAYMGTAGGDGNSHIREYYTKTQ
ncbi:hypothetical protein LJ739_08620 [Aestuariibacter halophilus]|uniref:DUF4488 domain-containing protein n=1 Tax=Fluctibacter halophilus TaxID=226011 RepID=A0ABS8G6S8_9ALTE|nr:hypothetical protein [Aestuariibacter halophilus]MCC2616302.1 hypothetical protein [Aestuariibacter halophilus]